MKKLVGIVIVVVLIFVNVYVGIYGNADKRDTLEPGWNRINDVTYYGDEDGKYVTGWQNIEGERYYFGEKSGEMQKGLQKVGEETYFFDEESGKMQTGFLNIGKEKYYFGKNTGKMYTGVRKIKKDVYTFSEKGVLERTVFGDKKAIALTYDDGPSPNTKKILKVLRENDGRATFFVVGNRTADFKDTLKQISKEGSQIGNHSWDHGWYGQMSPRQIKRQIAKCNNSVERKTGEEVTICRTPGGDSSKKVMKSVGMPVILWSLDTLDWKTRNAESTYKAVMKNAKDGDIVLMHDLYDTTASASKKIIPTLKKKGYQIVTIEELRLLKGYKLEDGKAYLDFK